MDEIILPTEEEIKENFKNYNKLLKWAQSLTQEQIDFLCNGGWYNNTIKGYLIYACENEKMNREQIKSLLQKLNWAFDDHNKKEADKKYIDF